MGKRAAATSMSAKGEREEGFPLFSMFFLYHMSSITTALVTTLFQAGFSLVVLNVLADNAPAIHIYQRLGFQTHHHFLTGRGIRL